MTPGVCKHCETVGSRQLAGLAQECPQDYRVSSLVCQAVKQIIDKISPLPARGNDEQHNVTFSADGALASIFGGDDAGLSMHAGSRYWSVLACLGHELQGKAGVAVRLRSVSQAQGDPAALSPDDLKGNPGAVAHSILSESLEGSESTLAPPEELCGHTISPHEPSCKILSMRISWAEPLSPAVMHVCGSLLRCWFPAHATATRPCWALASLSALSFANRIAAPAAVLGHWERCLVDQVLNQCSDSWAATEPSVNGMPVGGLRRAAGTFEGSLPLKALHGGGGLGDKGRSLSINLPMGHLAREQDGAALLATLPYCGKVEWRSFGQSERQGHALVTLTNGAF